jgi:uncharacterized protein
MSTDFHISVDISKEFAFNENGLSEAQNNIWVKNSWPIVYFLQNSETKNGYVGESTNGYDRICNHLKDTKKRQLQKVTIIGSDKFNKSAVLDIESQLIQHFSSEGTWKLLNANNGRTFHEYYQRNEYAGFFRQIWKTLVEKKIVTKSLEEIQSSNFFKYSPYKSLNRDQYQSVQDIIEVLNGEKSNHVFVSGSAGTGKTILATYLIKLLQTDPSDLKEDDLTEEGLRELQLVKEFRSKNQHPSIALVIAMTSLRVTLQKVFDAIPGLSANMVISPSETFKKKYDILIIDEAHRLRQRKNISWMKVFSENNAKINLGNEGTELDWILENSKKQIFFYDSAQSIKPSDIPAQKFQELIQKPETVKLSLKSQMRVQAGSDYIQFIDDLLNCTLDDTGKAYRPEAYDLRFFESFKDMHRALAKREKEHTLCRLVAGYSWPWVTKKDNTAYDIEIENIRLCWNKTDKDWINTPTSFSEVGCIHTTQGYDLNYVGVIFGKEITYNPETNTIEIDPKNYFDRNGKAGIKDKKELKDFIINIYKTILYRGIKGAYIYASDENLREYFKKHVAFQRPQPNLKIVEKSGLKIYPERVENSVPFFNLKAAAGAFSDFQDIAESEWIDLTWLGGKYSPDTHFVCQVVGNSMNRVIDDGSYCLFRKDPGGSRKGKIVLVGHRDIQDVDTGGSFTVKYYDSKKVEDEEDDEGWEHESIVLKPSSYDASYEDIVLTEDQAVDFKVYGVFVKVIG